MIFCRAIILSIGAVSAPIFASPDSHQELMSTWLGLESQKGHLQQSWLDRKASMEEKLHLFQIEKESLSELVNETAKENSEASTQRKDLLAKQQKLELEEEALKKSVSITLNKMKAIVTRLPPPVATQWQEKIELIDTEEISTSEKLEALLNLLKISDEFDSRIALNKSAINTPNTQGQITQRVVNQIYIGLSQAWYVSDDGTQYGYGRAGPNGWQWWAGNEASTELGVELKAQHIIDVLNILKNPTHAEYVPLPVLLK